MILFFQIFSLICISLVIYTYLFYPILLILFHSFKSKKFVEDQIYDYKPIVSCIIAVYNEEAVIGEKLRSLLTSDYPKDKLHIYVGSDDSTDASNEMIRKEFSNSSNCNFFEYKTRSGKSSVINRLLDEVFKITPPGEDHLLIYTDANVLLEKDTISKFALSFADDQIALVDSKIIQKSFKTSGISTSEKEYMRSESFIKYLEGELWGLSMGAFGGCYALRSTYGIKVPDNILVDDFYISLMTMIKGGKSITNAQAVCFETIPDEMEEEFRRKQRISAGNFQNLSIFRSHIKDMGILLLFVFISHKVLRWFGPFFLTGLLVSSFYFVFNSNDLFFILGIASIFLLVILPLIDFLFKYFGLQFKLLRGWSYFVIMNIALLSGFFRYLFGVQGSSWQPPKRI